MCWRVLDMLTRPNPELWFRVSDSIRGLAPLTIKALIRAVIEHFREER